MQVACPASIPPRLLTAPALHMYTQSDNISKGPHTSNTAVLLATGVAQPKDSKHSSLARAIAHINSNLLITALLAKRVPPILTRRSACAHVLTCCQPSVERDIDRYKHSSSLQSTPATASCTQPITQPPIPHQRGPNPRPLSLLSFTRTRHSPQHTINKPHTATPTGHQACHEARRCLSCCCRPAGPVGACPLLHVLHGRLHQLPTFGNLLQAAG